MFFCLTTKNNTVKWSLQSNHKKYLVLYFISITLEVPIMHVMHYVCTVHSNKKLDLKKTCVFSECPG